MCMFRKLAKDSLYLSLAQEARQSVAVSPPKAAAAAVSVLTSCLHVPSGRLSVARARIASDTLAK